MADSIKINKLEIENVKRIKAVKIEPTKNGLTIVGGNNNQGKTSVLDSIAWALGGDRYKPSNATRDGSTIPPNLHIVMSNGLVVERKGKNSSLKVTDPNGNKGGQQLLNDFVEQLALDLPKFMESSGKEKAQTLLKIIGVGDQLTALEQQEKELYNERLYVGRTADQKVKFAKEQPYYPDAPKDLVSPSDLIKQQQEILARNGKNEEYRRNAVNMKAEYDSLNMEIENLRKMLQEKMERHEALSEALEAANKTVSELHDESTAELEASIANIEEINRKVRANLDKDKAEEDARAYQDQYNELTKKIEGVRDQKTELLNAADLPLPELSVKEGELIYKGQQWVNVGMALKHEGYSVDVWDTWSKNDRRYHSGECEKKWNTFHGSNSPVTAGTIVQLAMEHGWKPSYTAFHSLARSLGSVSVPDWVPGVGGKSFSLPKMSRLKIGMDYVPCDMYPAYLDEGEWVLTKEEANILRSYGGLEGMIGMLDRNSSNVSVNVQNQNREFDYEKFGRAAADAMITAGIGFKCDEREFARLIKDLIDYV